MLSFGNPDITESVTEAECDTFRGDCSLCCRIANVMMGTSIGGPVSSCEIIMDAY